jgi:shikimate kinase
MPLAGPPPSRKLIALAGFMGSGKTTVGRLLASQLGWRFLDLDTLIEERAGLSISAIFERHGEPAFREMEHAALQRTIGKTLERGLATVLALGGGTFAQPLNVELLRAAGAAVVWLRCPTETLLARCATMANRPLFRDENSFLELYRQRLPFYEQAEFRVESAGEPRRVAEAILALGLFERVTA